MKGLALQWLFAVSKRCCTMWLQGSRKHDDTCFNVINNKTHFFYFYFLTKSRPFFEGPCFFQALQTFGAKFENRIHIWKTRRGSSNSSKTVSWDCIQRRRISLRKTLEACLRLT